LTVINCIKAEDEKSAISNAKDDNAKYCVYAKKRMQMQEDIWASQKVCDEDQEKVCKNMDKEKCKNWDTYKSTLSPTRQQLGVLCKPCGVCVTAKQAAKYVKSHDLEKTFLPKAHVKINENKESETDPNGERMLENEVCSVQAPYISFPGCYCLSECMDEYNECATRDNIDVSCCAGNALSPDVLDDESCKEYYSNYPQYWWTHPIYSINYDPPTTWDMQAPHLKTQAEIDAARKEVVKHYKDMLAAANGGTGPVAVDELVPRRRLQLLKM
jgi:hypothetical protein